MVFAFFFFNDTATTEIYTLSLHDALPILAPVPPALRRGSDPFPQPGPPATGDWLAVEPDGPVRGILERRSVLRRSEEHTSELQSRQYLVCRLLLEKKNITKYLDPTSRPPS